MSSSVLEKRSHKPRIRTRNKSYSQGKRESKRLSESSIWRVQRDYFESVGIDAWRKGTVPHYITSNPTTARAYAEIFFGFLRDRAALAPNAGQPVYLLELGAGSGRFAFHFLKTLTELRELAPFQIPDFCYIISDFSEKNIGFCRQHPQLHSFIEQGVLDFALFDAEKDQSLKLRVSGGQLQQGSLNHPMVVFANYFFDSIPQDLFYVDGGKLSETGVRIDNSVVPDQNGEKGSHKEIEVNYENRPVTLPYYDEPVLDALLTEYEQTLSDTYLMLPSIGIRCLQRLRSLSQEGLLLLSADKGYHRTEDLIGRSAPSLAHHGNLCVSLSVNYHALLRFCEQQGGLALFAPHRHHSIDVACLLMVKENEKYSETHLAHTRFVEKFGPDDFFSLKKHFEETIPAMSLRHIMAYLRLSGYDARLIKQVIPQIRKVLPDSSPGECRELPKVFHEVWEWYYNIGEKQDLAFDLGTLLYEMDAFPEALDFFQASIVDHGESAAALHNMAACCISMNRIKKGLNYLEKVLKIDPQHRAAIEMRNQSEVSKTSKMTG